MVWQISVTLMDVPPCSTNKAEPCVPNFPPHPHRFPLHVIFKLGLVVETELNQTNSRGVQIPG